MADMRDTKKSEQSLSEVFVRVCDLGIALGWNSIKDLPGCTEHQIDGAWWFAINPHNEVVKCSHGPEVRPYTIYFEFNGWPAGAIRATGGWVAAGTLANENTLLEAIEKAIEKETTK
jgi:hypothetical protein